MLSYPEKNNAAESKCALLTAIARICFNSFNNELTAAAVKKTLLSNIDLKYNYGKTLIHFRI